MSKTRSTYKDEGVVLHCSKFSERKLIVYMLTREHGRCNYITTVGRSTSRALFQPLTPLSFIAVRPSSSDGLHTLREAVISPDFGYSNALPLRSLIVMTLSEILYRTVKESDEAIFNFTCRATIALNSLNDKTAIANFHLYFLVHLASHVGYSLSGNWREGSYFDIKEGIYTPTEPRHPQVIAPEIASIIHSLTTLEIHNLSTLKLNGELRRRTLYSLIDYYGYHNDAIYSVTSISLLSLIHNS